MGIHRVLVNGKDKDGSAFGHLTAASGQGQEKKRSQRFEKLQEKMRRIWV